MFSLCSLFPNVPYPSRNPESYLEYRYPPKHINDHMLLDQQGRCKNAQRHQDRNDFVGAVGSFQEKGGTDACPALQTMNGRKKIDRGIHGVDQLYQTVAQTGSGDLRTGKSGWKQQKKEQTDDFGADIADGKAITQLPAVSGNENITDNPLDECKNIKKNKGSHKGKGFVKRSLPAGKGQKAAKLTDSGINKGIDQESQPYWKNCIFWYP